MARDLAAAPPNADAKAHRWRIRILSGADIDVDLNIDADVRIAQNCLPTISRKISLVPPKMRSARASAQARPMPYSLI